MENGLDIPIEEREEDEVLKMTGETESGKSEKINITIKGIKASNPAFDVTPAKYVTKIITDRGIIDPSFKGINTIRK